MLRFVVVSFGAALVGGATALGRFLDPRHLPAKAADAALVFGTGTDWKASSRIRTAAELFRCGRVRYLIVSGGVPEPWRGTEAEWFRRELIARGVPEERILLEDRATNTAENCAFALPLIQAGGFRSVVLVMSDFEGIRAHLTAKKAWRGQPIRLYNWHAPSPGHWHPRTWWLNREGWRWTWHTVSRLFRYRLLPHLWHR